MGPFTPHHDPQYYPQQDPNHTYNPHHDPQYYPNYYPHIDPPLLPPLMTLGVTEPAVWEGPVFKEERTAALLELGQSLVWSERSDAVMSR